MYCTAQNQGIIDAYTSIVVNLTSASPVYRDATECACLNLRAASRKVTQHYNALLRPSGLLVTQFSLLSMLAGQGSLSISALADMLEMDKTTLARNLEPLERDHLVGVTPKPEDRRVKMVTLTSLGRTRLNAAWPLWAEAQQGVEALVGVEYWPQVLGDLRRFTTSF